MAPTLTTQTPTPTGALTPDQMVQAQSASQTPAPLTRPATLSENVGSVVDLGKGIANALFSPVESLGAHLGQAVAGGQAQLAGGNIPGVSSLLGGQPEANKINQRFNAGIANTNLTGGNVTPLNPGGGGALQLAGDTAATAILPYLPESMGALKLAMMGSVSGAGQSLAAGNTSPSQVAGDAGTAALFGGTLGLLGKAAGVISSTEKGMTGVTPAMENELVQIRPSTLGKYIETAKNSAKDYHAPTVDSLIVNDITKGTDILETKLIPQAGKALDVAHANAKDVPITIQSADGVTPPETGTNAVNTLRDDINGVMQSMTGHQFSSYGVGEKTGLKIVNYPQGPSTTGLGLTEGGGIAALPGRVVELSKGDAKALESVAAQLDTLQNNPTVQTASDVLKNLDSQINWDRPQFGDGKSPVDGVIRYARGAINRTIAPAAPELAQANLMWGQLQDIRNGIGDAAGKDLQSINLLARRTTYKDQKGQAQNILDSLFNAVKPYLPPGEESYSIKAILAEYASRTFAGEQGVSGVAKSISTGEASALGGGGYPARVLSAALNLAKRKLAPDAAQYAMSIAKGEPYSFIPLVHHVDEFVDSPAANPLLQSFKNSLKAMGVSSANVGAAAKASLKAIILNQVSRPGASPLSVSDMMKQQGYQTSTPSLTQP